VKQSFRLHHLDGLRGVAIILVVMFHAYARWPELFPYGAAFAENPIFRHGRYGVQLFFLISGFVILMTLERSASVGDFLFRRWLRLFPAMLFCTLFLFATAPLFPDRPAGQPTLIDLLPGLSFIDSRLWSVFLGIPTPALEGAFWSLYVEAKVYLVLSLFFFWFGSNRAIVMLAIGFLLSAVLTHFLAWMAPPSGGLSLVFKLLGAEHYGWFAVGALVYRYTCTARLCYLIPSIVLALLSALAVKERGADAEFAALVVAALFFAAILHRPLHALLSHRLLIFFGVISYPLFLIHENMMVSMIVHTGRHLPWIPPLLIPAMPFVLVVVLSWLIAHYIEPALRKLIHSRLAPIFGAATTPS
jgi:peptidoglycan/LPS O-acetylase OafA/YrhL